MKSYQIVINSENNTKCKTKCEIVSNAYNLTQNYENAAKSLKNIIEQCIFCKI